MYEFAKIWTLQQVYQRSASVRNPFKGIADKPRFRRQLSALQEPAVRYVIFFTPRSGSSRLTELIESAGGCGSPGEHFNPELLGKAATFLGAQNLRDYIDLLSRRRGTSGVFGSEVTHSQLTAIFRNDARFYELFRPTSHLFLVREDVVAQAVSLSKMKQTGVAHTIGGPESGRNETGFHYSPRQIHDYLGRLLFMERYFENLFLRRKIEPLRMSYETLMNSDPQKYIPEIATYIGGEYESLENIKSQHQKTGGAISEDYAARFRRQHERLLIKIENYRKPTLARLAAHSAKYFGA